MIERLGRNTAVGLALVGVTMTGVACDYDPSLNSAGLSAEYADTAQIPRCYDTPQVFPEPEAPKTYTVPDPPEENASSQAWDAYIASEKATEDMWNQQEAAYQKAMNPPILDIPVTNGIAEGDPIMPKQGTIDATTRSLAEVSTPDWKGTGFETTDTENEQVIITAAHVVGTAALNQLTITMGDGRTVHPTSGCYIFEDGGKFSKLSSDTGSKADKTPRDTDIAVLKLPSNFAGTPLPLAGNEPGPGEWVSFINYQADYGPVANGRDTIPDPAAYTGVVTPTRATSHTLNVMTGAEDIAGHKLTHGDYMRTHITDGASGGPILNDAGEVIGASVDGTKEGVRLDAESLKVLYNVEFPGADNSDTSNFLPANATLMPVSILKAALSSTTLR